MNNSVSNRQNNSRWKIRPEGSNWGDFGPDDQKGRLNLLTPEKVMQGVAEVKEGKSFCLSLPLDYPGGNSVNPKRHPPQLRPTYHEGHEYYNMAWSKLVPGLTDVSADDVAIIHTQYSTQWDSLAHFGGEFDAMDDGTPERMYYNGFRAGTDVMALDDGDFEGVAAHQLGIHNMAETCVQGRAVMLDFHAHYGDERVRVNYDMLEKIMADDAIEIEPGDMLLIHTGWGQMILEMNLDPDAEKLHRSCAVLDSLDPKILEWVTDSGIAVIASDNMAVEDIGGPPRQNIKGSRLPLHEHCLFKLGIHLGEIWYLTELAGWLRENERSRLLLTAPPLRLTGAVGSPVMPVGTV